MVEEERIRAQNDPERAIESTETQLEQFEQPQADENCPQPLAEETLDAISRHSRSDTQDTSGMTSSHNSMSSSVVVANHPNVFGSSLEQDSRFLLMKARSESISSDGGRETPPMEALALSAEERRQLEAEMQAQSQHPLALRLRMEEEERWLQNELEHHRMAHQQRLVHNPRVLRLGDTSGRRDWNRILSALEQERNASDDVALLEATMTLSMEERRPYLESSAFGSARVTTSDLFMSGLSEEEQLAMAIAASLQASEPVNNNSNQETGGDESREVLPDKTPSASSDNL